MTIPAMTETVPEAALGGPSETTDPLDALDLFGTAFVANPYPTLDRLRTDAPVHHDPRTGLWLVSRHRDIRHVLLDPDAYRPDNAQLAVTPVPVAALRTLVRAGFSLPPALANNPTPSHTGLRRLVTRFFNAARVAAAVPVIERIATDLLDGVVGELAATGEADLVRHYARPLPCRVLTHLLGIDGTTPEELADWSDAALELFWGRPTPERQHELADLAADFHRWLDRTVRHARTTGAPPDSLIGALVRHRLPDGTPLDDATAVAACYFVFIAGQSTTGQLLSTVLYRALTEPDRWPAAAAAAEDDVDTRDWVEEVLRREPPVATWRRITARPVELAGTPLPEGAHLLLMLLGSGSDPEVFDDPERLCPHRANTRHHLAFGAGRHRCPGAALARTEAAVALRTAARRLPAIAVAEETAPPMLGLISFRAPLRLRVRPGGADAPEAPRPAVAGGPA
ncbi:cytochrome P450 [Allostreptomyces psammosilenae]|uniref:Cytochrome P450 n=1 Tax=Allostreptomyces psammosilenae TaxID=1892865 RepID=A0A852ZY52_9ACTN|nr:cytochrome P450 [Allostreptomyces psammosilenae]NYI06727.1 cytochrome P450 [Allostreptomyces psammosilenae]